MYKSNWKNVLVEPSDIVDVRYAGDGIINLSVERETHHLGGFAGQKILRMTKSYKRDLDTVENVREVEKRVLEVIIARKDPFVLRYWEPTKECLSVVGINYVPIDTAELTFEAMNEVNDLNPYVSETTALAYSRGYDRTTIVLAEQKALQVGDFVRSGLQILNNELGARAMRIQSFIERLRCKNGATSRKFGHEFSRIHLGDRNDIFSQFREAIKKVVDNRWNLADIMQKTIHIELTLADMEQAVAHHQQDGLISAKTATELVKVLQSGRYGSDSLSLYGLVNAYTGLATHGKNWTVRDQLESIVETKLLTAENRDQLLG